MYLFLHLNSSSVYRVKRKDKYAHFPYNLFIDVAIETQVDRIFIFHTKKLVRAIITHEFQTSTFLLRWRTVMMSLC